MDKQVIVGVFETNIQDLVQCDGYYTTVLEPTNDEMFGSIQVILHSLVHLQILAEQITDDHSETTLSINLDRFYHTPAHLYLIVSRLRPDGILIPIFRSKVLTKKKHNNTSPSDESPAEDEDASGKGFSFRELHFSNQLLLNNSMDSRMVVEAWNANPTRRDEYVGHTIVECRKFAQMKGNEKFDLVYDSDEMRALKANGVKVITGNYTAMHAFVDMMETKINSVSGSSLTVRCVEDVKEMQEAKDSNFLLCSDFFDLGNKYALGMKCALEVGVRCRARTAILRVSDVRSVYKNTFFDYKNCTDMDFIVRLPATCHA